MSHLRVYSSAISTRSLLRHYRCSFDLQFERFSGNYSARYKRIWDFTRISFSEIAIRIHQSSPFNSRNRLNRFPLGSSSFLPDSDTRWELNVSSFTFERSSSKSICSGASAPLMILNIAPSFKADYMAPLLRFIWGISDYWYNDGSWNMPA